MRRRMTGEKASVKLPGDRETSTRQTAYRLVEKLELSDEDDRQMEALLKYKKGDIRQNVLKLLQRRDDEGLELSVKRLLKDPAEEVREGGLTLVREAKIGGRRRRLSAGSYRRPESWRAFPIRNRFSWRR